VKSAEAEKPTQDKEDHKKEKARSSEKKTEKGNVCGKCNKALGDKKS